MFAGDFTTLGTRDLYAVDLLAPTAEAAQINAPLAAGNNIQNFFVSAESSGTIYMVDTPSLQQLWWLELDETGAAPTMLDDAYVNLASLRPDRSEVFYVKERSSGERDLVPVVPSGSEPSAAEVIVGNFAPGAEGVGSGQVQP